MLQLQPCIQNISDWDALADRFHFAYEALEPSSPPALIGDSKDLLDACKENGRFRSFHGAFIDINPASGDREIARVSAERCRRSCEQALYIGADHVIFHCSAFPYLRDDGYLQNWTDRSAAFFSGLAGEYGLKVSIENCFDLDPIPLRLLMEKAEGKLSACLDIGHAHYSRIHVRDWFKELNPFIGYLHISDNGGLFDDHIALGTGSVNWKEADELTRGLMRDVPVTLEVRTIEDAEQSLDYLSRNHFFGM